MNFVKSCVALCNTEPEAIYNTLVIPEKQVINPLSKEVALNYTHWTLC